MPDKYHKTKLNIRLKIYPFLFTPDKYLSRKNIYKMVKNKLISSIGCQKGSSAFLFQLLISPSGNQWMNTVVAGILVPNMNLSNEDSRTCYQKHLQKEYSIKIISLLTQEETQRH